MIKEDAKVKLEEAIKSHRAGEHAHAESLCRQILDRDSDCLDAVILLNKILIAQNNTQGRVSLLLKAVTDNPESASHLFLLGNLYRQQRKFNLAADAYRKADKILPSEPKILAYLGICLHGLNCFNEAHEVLSQATLLDDGNETAWFFLGLSLEELRENDKAIESYKKAIKTNPYCNDSGYYYSAHVNLGHLFGQKGDHNQAIYNYKKAINAKASGIEACINLSLSYNQLSRLEEAVFYACKAIALQPDNKNAHKTLLFVARITGDSSKIISSCQYSIRVNPCNSIAYKILGSALYQKGALSLSTKAFELYCKYEPLIKVIKLSPNRSCQFKPTLCIADDLELPRGTHLIPSYSSGVQPKIKHLIYAHIPKTGGVNFANPICNCINTWYADNQVSKFWDLLNGIYSCNELKFISSYLVDNPPEASAVNKILRSNSEQKIDFTFLRSHKVSHKEIYSSFKDHFGFLPFRLAVYRDPISRLKSHFNHQWRLGTDIETMMESVRSRAVDLDNLIYRSCFSDFDRDLNNGLYNHPEIDALIKLGDFSNLHKIQSAILSSFLLPNIITTNRLNHTKELEALNSELLNDLVNECIQRGHIKHDLSQQVQSLVVDTIPKGLINESSTANAQIHPITYLYKVTDKFFNFSGQMLPTEFLKTAEGIDYMHRFFNDTI